MSNRLQTIATRQRSTRVRDLVFVAFIAFVSVVSITSVNTAIDVANVKVAAR